MKKQFGLILIAILFLSSVANAESESIVLDGKSYTRNEIIDGFIEVAFSEKQSLLPKANRLPPDKEDYPWLAEYAYREKGMPKSDVIHKWERKKVSISLDWPRYTLERKDGYSGVAKGGEFFDRKENRKYYCSFSSLYCEFPTFVMEGKYGDFLPYLQTLLPVLEKASGLNIEFRSPFDDVEKTNDYSQIRIVGVKQNRQENFFKIFRWYPNVQEYVWSIKRNEDSLSGDVRFTPFVRSQVDGYLLPNVDSSLGLSVCKIMPAVGVEMMKSLLSECLVRALGLPDIANEASSILSFWNKAYNDVSVLYEIDKQEATSYPDYPKNVSTHEDFLKLKLGTIRREISEYDLMMIKILYCGDIKNGMSKVAVQEVLRSKKCF